MQWERTLKYETSRTLAQPPQSRHCETAILVLSPLGMSGIFCRGIIQAYVNLLKGVLACGTEMATSLKNMRISK